MWVEVECSIGESLACVKGRNSKPPSGRTWECSLDCTDTPSLECVLVHMLIP